LFLLLDRTSALSDTSLFGAVLVGVGYERIIAGSSQNLRAPGEVSQLWTPFLAYADRVAQIVWRQSARAQARLAERVIASIVEEPQRYAALEALAMRFSPDVAALQAQLAAIDQTAGARGPDDVLEQKARLLYGIVFAAPDGHYLLKSRGIVSPRLYWLYIKRFNSIIQSALTAIAVVVLVAVGYRFLVPDYREQLATYYVWRVVKTNSTPVDQFRARRRLYDLAIDQPKIEKSITRQLAMQLRRPAVSMERVDLILQTLLESRAHSDGNPELPKMLVQALRSSSVDARTRINDVLKFLSQSCSTRPDDKLQAWKPSEGDSTAMLEEWIKRWGDYWATPCSSQKA
jgi:hypothetical protein